MIRLVVKNSLRKSRNIHSTHSRSFHDGIQLQQAGFGKVLAILTPIAAGAGVVAYAKYDSKFRQTLIDNVPGIDPVLKVLLQEEGNAIEKARKSIDSAAETVTEYTSSITSYFGGASKEEKPKQSTPKSKELPQIVSSSASSVPKKESLNVPAPPLESPTASSKPKPAASSPSSSSSPASSSSAASAIKKPAEPAAPVTLSPAPPLPTTITELEHSLEVAARTAVKEYEKAIHALKSYSDDVKKTLDRSIENFDSSIWASLKNKTSARNTAVAAAETAAYNAMLAIETLEKSLTKISGAAPEKIENVRNTIRKYSNSLSQEKDALYEAKNSASIAETYWKNVESARNYFTNEMEALFPGINMSEKKINMPEEDIDLFILYAYSHVLAYQKDLQKLQIEGETRLQHAIDALRGDDQTEAVKQQLEFHLEKEKQQLNIENQKKLFKIQVENEKRVREQLKVQSEAHSDHLSDAINQKEKELRRIFNREMSEKLSNEQAAYKSQLAAMLGKLKGMDAALKEIDDEMKARADTDRQVHQAQSLWSACQALWASVRTGEPGESGHKRLRPLQNEIAAVNRAGDGDDLVKAVLKAVPNEAKKRGVYPEDALRERFFKVDKIARRVALVPEKGASLPLYLMSYLQSVFIITPSEPISKVELDNEPFDFSQLDTYDILNRAKYWIERGNLIQAVKYMNLLKGAPRNVAKDWMKEARLLLETQQATNTLMAHAATSGLSFL